MKKTIFSLVIVFFALSLIPVNLHADETANQAPFKKRLSVSFYIAGIIGGPINDMKEAMINAGFDDRGLFDKKYPVSHGPSNAPYMVSVAYLFKPSFGAGFIYSESDLGGISGCSSPLIYVRTKYSVTTIAPIFFVKAGILKFGLGPALHSAYSVINESSQQNRKSKFGFVADIGFEYLVISSFFVEIKAQYRYVGKVEIGPYQATSTFTGIYQDNISHTLPATQVNYSHLFIGAGIGFRL
jgi:hypothetical protein